MTKPLDAYALAESFRRLPTREERQTFLRLIGCNADQLHRLLDDFPKEESERFLMMILDDFGRVIGPTMIEIGFQAAERTEGQNRDGVRAMIKEGYVNHALAAMETARAEVKKERNRKPAPENARRKAYVCMLKDRDSVYWTHTRIEEFFGFDKQEISRILRNKSKWMECGKAAGANDIELDAIIERGGLAN